MNDKVIYTCITGGYDKLIQPAVVYPGFDYICFTDEPKPEKDGVWEFRSIPYDTADKIRLSRYVKLMPHMALKDYTFSVYIDSNILILDNYLFDRVERMIRDCVDISLSRHPENRKDIYEEAAYVMKFRRAAFSDVKRQIIHLREEGYPEYTGMFENNVIFRKHNAPEIIELDTFWWDEFSNFTRRDQLSFVFVLWKKGIRPEDLIEEGDRMNVRTKASGKDYHLKRIIHSSIDEYRPSFLTKCWNHLKRIVYEIPRFLVYKLYFRYGTRIYRQ